MKILRVILPALIGASMNFASAEVISRPCPYSCQTLGLDSSECRDFREGDDCFVEKLSTSARQPRGGRICLQTTSGRLRIRNKCLSADGETEASYESLRGPSGETGAVGPGGADGTLRVFGDGSAGDVTVSASTVFNSDNPQFRDFTIASGVTLTVPSGTVIRCTGNFSNLGTIIVLPALRQHPKISESGQSAGVLQSGGTEAAGGEGGSALPEGAAKQIIRAGLLGGGDGYKLDSQAGSAGGGNLVVLAAGTISNRAGAVINADGQDGGELSRGGGGGGIIIFAARTSIENAGSIQARGGTGADLDPNNGSNNGFAAGGGGGGGIVNLMAPAVSNSGTITVSGGAGGPAGGAGSITALFYFGGGGGGASGGDGGDGGKVNPGSIGDDSTSAGESGTVGKTFLTTADPTSLY